MDSLPLPLTPEMRPEVIHSGGRAGTAFLPFQSEGLAALWWSQGLFRD